MVKTKIMLLKKDDVKRMELAWHSCRDTGGTIEYDHNEWIGRRGHCPRCGEATHVTFKLGDMLTLYIYHDDLIRIEVGGVTYFLDYPKMKRVAKGSKGKMKIVAKGSKGAK